MTNQVFILSLKEIPIEFLCAFLIQFLFGNKLATKMAFKIVDPKVDKPIFVILAITCMSILIMCPSMSLIATVMHDGINKNFLANWLQKMVFNFPFAFFTQIFLIGPIVRKIFGFVLEKVFPRKTFSLHNNMRLPPLHILPCVEVEGAGILRK